MKLHIFEENSKYGYRDENETIVIPAKYENAKDFNNNCAIVMYNGFFGVINSSDKPVIDFIYNSILEHNLFFECINFQENESNQKTLWYNRNGVILHDGNANSLSDEYLCVSNGNNVGIINHDGEQIINYLYEKIILKKDFFVVLRKGLIGVFDLAGRVVIDVICKSIEQVIIENDWNSLGADPKELQKTIPSYFATNILFHSRYNKSYYFDTCNDIPSWNLKREVLSEQDFRKERVYSRNTSPIEEFTAPIIITTESGKSLFLKGAGILPNSEYEDVQQITSISYVVKRNDLYGIYRVDTKSIIIPIEYEAIRFYGGHTVLLCKDGLWGAKDILLDEPFNAAYKVSIPTEYLEISILDDFQCYFGCKITEENVKLQYYTIIRSNGEEIIFNGYHRFNSQFKYYDSSHIMTSIDDKFGFMSVDGYNTIPFKYDEIRQRDDEKFDVRIEDIWGLLTLDGRDSLGIKLEKPLQGELNKNIIVQDAESKCFGVIDKDGILIIPAIYEHLYSTEDNNLFFFKYDGWPGDDGSSIGDPYAKWGVVNSSGKEIVKPKYGFCKLDYHFILAGRDSFNYKTNPTDAIYDLYTKDGELLIGGFSEYLYDEKHELFFFFFGGEFECGGERVVWGDFGEHDSWEYYEKFDRGPDKWLILDKNLTTVICDEEGKRYQFSKGFIGKVDIMKEGKKKTFVYNIPLEYLVTIDHQLSSRIMYIIGNNSIIIKYGTQAVDIATGKMTKEFSHIEQITDKLFLFKSGNTIGITNINSEILIDNCFLITLPVSNYIFLAKEKPEDRCCVYLYDINNFANPIAIAINDITKEKLIDMAEMQKLKIKYENKSSGLKSIVLPISDNFDEEFISKVTIEEKRNSRSLSYRNTRYFVRGEFSKKISTGHKDITQYANDYEVHNDIDYKRDTWDAMTDGMYGDYPEEGFDGDYDFMGF